MTEIIENIFSQKAPSHHDIPKLDLYMDQIISLFNEMLQDDKRHDDDKLMTKAMINNYSKAGLIDPVKGKKYNREQILQMLLIYRLKNTLSMQDIKKVVTPLYEQNFSIEEIYDQVTTLKDQQNDQTKAMIESFMQTEELDLNQDIDRFLLIIYLSSLSQQVTRMVEKIIDTYYD